jgi:tRNA threonylcarbamoyladenosine biosynthesis protein TsaB
MATAKGLALGADCPVVGVSTLDALAWRFAPVRHTVVPVIDARKGRLYAALYRAGERRSEYLDLEPDALAEALRADSSGGPYLLTGPHAAAFAKDLRRRGTEAPSFDVDPSFADTDPQALLTLGLRRFASAGGDPPTLAPIYLRASEAERKAAGSP